MKFLFSFRANFLCAFRIAGLVTAVLVAGCDERNSEKRPNIIYILADDLGYAEVGCYGQED